MRAPDFSSEIVAPSNCRLCNIACVSSPSGIPFTVEAPRASAAQISALLAIDFDPGTLTMASSIPLFTTTAYSLSCVMKSVAKSA